jgi:hypothetical protein
MLRTVLPSLIRELGIETLLDLPCGDYSWMRTIDLPVASYVGADLLPELIHRLNAEHASASHRFVALDLTRNRLPPADLLFCRDCLVHLSYADIRLALGNVSRSGIPYIVTTTFPSCEANEDIVTGDWRVLNLERPPFDLPPPLRLITEGCTEDLRVNLGRLVAQCPAKLVAELRGVRMPMLFDGVPHSQGQDFLLRAGNGDAAVPLAGNTSAVDHLAGSAHNHL